MQVRLWRRLQGWVYGHYLDLRYGKDEWVDGYAEDPLGGSWSL